MNPSIIRLLAILRSLSTTNIYPIIPPIIPKKIGKKVQAGETGVVVVSGRTLGGAPFRLFTPLGINLPPQLLHFFTSFLKCISPHFSQAKYLSSIIHLFCFHIPLIKPIKTGIISSMGITHLPISST